MLKKIFLILMISLIQNSLQSADSTLTDTILYYKNKAVAKINEYKNYFENATSQNMTKNEIEKAVYFNKTGISNLEQSTTNQKTEGIKYAYVSKYFASISRRLHFTDEVTDYFQPIFIKASEQSDEWKSYELMYNSDEEEDIFFINFLVKNRFESKKIDVIINQVSMKFKISKFILIQESSTDASGHENKDVKYITENVPKSEADNSIQVIQDVIQYTSYKSLIEFLGIDENDKVKQSLLFLK